MISHSFKEKSRRPKLSMVNHIFNFFFKYKQVLSVLKDLENIYYKLLENCMGVDVRQKNF